MLLHQAEPAASTTPPRSSSLEAEHSSCSTAMTAGCTTRLGGQRSAAWWAQQGHAAPRATRLTQHRCPGRPAVLQAESSPLSAKRRSPCATRKELAQQGLTLHGYCMKPEHSSACCLQARLHREEAHRQPGNSRVQAELCPQWQQQSGHGAASSQ